MCIASGVIAQLGERYDGIVEVGGSIPPGSTNPYILPVNTTIFCITGKKTSKKN
jgi:hypothetical protein